MLTDTSYLRNPHYHMATDTPETFDYDRMADVTIGVAGGVAKLARGAVQLLITMYSGADYSSAFGVPIFSITAPWKGTLAV